MLEVMFSDNMKSREMLSDGSYVLKDRTGKEIVSQEYFMREAMLVENEENDEELTLFRRWKQFFTGQKK